MIWVEPGLEMGLGAWYPVPPPFLGRPRVFEATLFMA